MRAKDIHTEVLQKKTAKNGCGMQASDTLLVPKPKASSRRCGCATTSRTGASDKTYTDEAGLLPAAATTGARNNDTSVIRGSATMKAGR